MIVVVVCLVCRCVRRAAYLYFRDAMRKTMDQILDILGMVFPLVQLQDQELFSFLDKSGVHPSVAAPWILTWFSHSLGEFSTVARLFDFFLASPPIMCVCICIKTPCMQHHPEQQHAMAGWVGCGGEG